MFIISNIKRSYFFWIQDNYFIYIKFQTQIYIIFIFVLQCKSINLLALNLSYMQTKGGQNIQDCISIKIFQIVHQSF